MRNSRSWRRRALVLGALTCQACGIAVVSAFGSPLLFHPPFSFTFFHISSAHLPFPAFQKSVAAFAGLSAVVAQTAAKKQLRGSTMHAACDVQAVGATIKSANMNGVFWQGGQTLQVSRDLHAENRARVIAEFKTSPDGLIVVQGGADLNRADTDHHLLFRQESNFHFLFGVEFPDCYGTIDTATGRATLFVPRLPEAYTVWMGPPPTVAEFKDMYKVHEVKYVDELADFVAALAPPLLYLYGGMNTDSGSKGSPASFDGIEKYTSDTTKLHRALQETRVVKSQAKKKTKKSYARHTATLSACVPYVLKEALTPRRSCRQRWTS